MQRWQRLKAENGLKAVAARLHWWSVCVTGWGWLRRGVVQTSAWVCLLGAVLASLQACGGFGSSCAGGVRPGSNNGACSDASHFVTCEGGEGYEYDQEEACPVSQAVCTSLPDHRNHLCRSQDQIDCVTDLPGAAGRDLRVADLNGDGLSDLVYLNGDTLYASFASATGSFPTGAALAQLTQEFRLAQLDTDGMLDLAVLDRTGEVSVAFGKGNGTFGAPRRLLSGAVHLLGAGDLDKDSAADLIVESDPGRFMWLSSARDFAPTDFGITIAAQATNAVASIAANGVPQLALSDASQRTQSFTHNGDRWSLDQQLTGTVLTADDFNHDGEPDLVLTSSNSTQLQLADGTGRYQLGVSVYGAALFAADLNGDGTLDLEMQRPTGLTPLHGRGDGAFDEGAPLQLSPSFQSAALITTAQGPELIYASSTWSVVSTSCLTR